MGFKLNPFTNQLEYVQPGGNSFSFIQTPVGTTPAADNSTDTLSFTSTDGSAIITGNSVSDTVDFGMGKFQLPVTAVTIGTHTVAASDNLITVNNAGAVAITLPSAASVAVGKVYIICDISGAAGVNNITISRAGADTINGATSQVINSNYGVLRLVRASSVLWIVI